MGELGKRSRFRIFPSPKERRLAALAGHEEEGEKDDEEDIDQHVEAHELRRRDPVQQTVPDVRAHAGRELGEVANPRHQGPSPHPLSQFCGALGYAF